MVIIRTPSRAGRDSERGARRGDYILCVRTVVLYRRSGPVACSVSSCNLLRSIYYSSFLPSTTKFGPCCVVSFRTGMFWKDQGLLFSFFFFSEFEQSNLNFGTNHHHQSGTINTTRQYHTRSRLSSSYLVLGTYAHDLSEVGGARGGATLCACH